jgi:hypothetical protein
VSVWRVCLCESERYSTKMVTAVTIFVLVCMRAYVPLRPSVRIRWNLQTLAQLNVACSVQCVVHV